MHGFLTFKGVLFLWCMSAGLIGCVDLSSAKLSPEKKSAYLSYDATHSVKNNADINPASTQYSGEIHTMLGGLGIFSVGMNDLRDTLAKEYKHVSASSNMWYNAGDVSHAIIHHYYATHNISHSINQKKNHIINKNINNNEQNNADQHASKTHRPIILMGHSLGANEQIKVARNLNAAGIPVDLLITVDAVSQTIVPPNVKRVLNIYKPGYIPMFSGLKLRAVDPNATKIININVDECADIDVSHFTIDKNKRVQALILDAVKTLLLDN